MKLQPVALPRAEEYAAGKPNPHCNQASCDAKKFSKAAKSARPETSHRKERETQESSKKGVEDTTKTLLRKNIEDQNLEQSKAASQKDDRAPGSTPPRGDAGDKAREERGARGTTANTNAGRALARSAQRRDVNWNTAAAQPYAKLMNMSDRGLSRLVTSALRRPDGQLGNLPVKFKVFNSNVPGNGKVEALTSNGTIFISSRMASLARSNDPQARAVFASILREELAEAAYQGQKRGFSQGDFGEETTLRMKGEYTSLSDAQKNALKTNSDTASITVNGAKTIGEAAAKPQTFKAYTTDGNGGLKVKTLRTSGAQQTFFAEKGPGGRYWIVATPSTPKSRRKLVKAPIAGSYVKKTQSTGQYRLEIPTTVVTVVKKKKSTGSSRTSSNTSTSSRPASGARSGSTSKPTPTIIPPNQATQFRGKYKTKYFVAHLKDGKWEPGSVKSGRTAYWVSVLLKKGKELPEKIARSSSKSSVKLVPVTFTGVKTSGGYKVASSKSKGTRYTVKAEVVPKDFFKNKKNGTAKPGATVKSVFVVGASKKNSSGSNGGSSGRSTDAIIGALSGATIAGLGAAGIKGAKLKKLIDAIKKAFKKGKKLFDILKKTFEIIDDVKTAGNFINDLKNGGLAEAKLLKDVLDGPLKSVGSLVASKIKTIFPPNEKMVSAVVYKTGDDRFTQITNTTPASKKKYKILAVVPKSQKGRLVVDAVDIISIKDASKADIQKAKSGSAADIGDYDPTHFAFGRGSIMDFHMIPADTEDSSGFKADTSGDKLASVLNDLNVKDAIGHMSVVLNDQKHSDAFFKSVFGDRVSADQKAQFINKFEKLQDAIENEDISASDAASLSKELGFNFGQFGSAGADYDGYYQAATKNLGISDALIGTAGGVGIEGRWLSRVMVEELVHSFADSTGLVDGAGAVDQGRAAVNYLVSTMKFQIGDLADVPDEDYVRTANGAGEDDSVEIEGGTIKSRAATGASTTNFFMGQLRFSKNTNFASLGEFEVRFPTINSTSGTGDDDTRSWFTNVGKAVAKKDFRWDLHVRLAKEIRSSRNGPTVLGKFNGGTGKKFTKADRKKFDKLFKSTDPKYFNVNADISVKLGFKGKTSMDDFTMIGKVNKNIPYISDILKKVAPSKAAFDTAISGGLSVKVVKGKPVHAVVFGQALNNKNLALGTTTLKKEKNANTNASVGIIGRNTNITYAGWVKGGKRLDGSDVD